MRIQGINPKDAEKMMAEIKAAPMLDLSKEQIFEVARIGLLPPWNERMTAHFQTTDGQRFRLPPELTGWAYDCVSLAQGFHNPFPCAVRFGRSIHTGEIIAEVDVDPVIEPLWQPGRDHAAEVAAFLKRGKK